MSIVCTSDDKINCPFVSVCTPTFNRRPFIPLLIRAIHAQTYPQSRIEWIVCDDGTDAVDDLLKDISFCKYLRCDKMSLGKKRNFMHTQCVGDIIVNMDDDDYYPPERIAHAVHTLINNPSIHLVGSSAMFMYSYNSARVYKCGPYGDMHCTAATMAFRKSLLAHTKYDDSKCVAEEPSFLKNSTIPMIQLDPHKTILVFSHVHNSYNKEEMIADKESTKTVLTNLTVDNFISDSELKLAYLNINDVLESYAYGNPKHKPDVIKQINDLKQSRQERTNELKKQAIIRQIQNDEISIEFIESRLHQPCSTYLTDVLNEKNRLIEQLFSKIKQLQNK